MTTANMRTTGMLLWLSIIISGIICSRHHAKAQSCERAYHIFPNKPSVSFQMGVPGRANKCTWTVIGDRNCPVELSCKVDIRKESPDCDTGEFLKVTDGSVGRKFFCGKTEFFDLRASEGLRDLYVVLQTLPSSPKQKLEGISCTARCGTPGEGKKLQKNFDRKFEKQCVCGLKNDGDRIVGGQDAKKFEWPWQAAVVYNGTRMPMCGASLINDRFILCAAHCFYFQSIQPWDVDVLLHAHLLDQTKTDDARDVAMGQKNSIRSRGYDFARVTDKDEKTLRLKVTQIINHPLFTDLYDYDYALLKIDRKITLSEQDAPTPVCLPPSNTWDSYKLEGRNLTVVGWGKAHEDAGGSTRLLQKLEVPFINFDKCHKWVGRMLTQRMLCAGFDDGVKDACTGDSGGPLIMASPEKKTENMWFQWGVVSWGEGCARAKRPGIYSRVTEMMQWIHFHTSEQDAKWCKESK